MSRRASAYLHCPTLTGSQELPVTFTIRALDKLRIVVDTGFPGRPAFEVRATVRMLICGDVERMLFISTMPPNGVQHASSGMHRPDRHPEPEEKAERLEDAYPAQNGLETIHDFQVGADGGWLDFSRLFASLGYAGNDPIADGYLRVVQLARMRLCRLIRRAGEMAVSISCFSYRSMQLV